MDPQDAMLYRRLYAAKEAAEELLTEKTLPTDGLRVDKSTRSVKITVNDKTTPVARITLQLNTAWTQSFLTTVETTAEVLADRFGS